MNGREAIHAAVGAFVAFAIAGTAWSLHTPSPVKPTVDPAARIAETVSDEAASLRAANANLVDDLRACDRQLADLRDQLGSPPVASAVAQEPREREDRDGGRRRRGRGEPTREDWDRMAETGSLRVRTPCLRDKPWTPSQRTMDRLGLAPQDGVAIREAYEQSNKRLADQIKPLCAQVLGSAEAAERVGPAACKDAIVSGARRTDPEGTRSAAVRVAEVNSGKRDAAQAGAGGSPFEQLMLVMTKEGKSFESDLAKRLGPDEAKRLAWAPEMCSDRTNVRGNENDGEDDRRGY